MRTIAIASLLLACTEQHSGDVAARETRPAHYETTYTKVGYTLVPNTAFYPESCLIILTDGWVCAVRGNCDNWPLSTRLTADCSKP